jgi:SAM-dependent methyltransferase
MQKTYPMGNFGQIKGQIIEFPVDFVSYVGAPKTVYLRFASNKEIYLHLNESKNFFEWARKLLFRHFFNLKPATWVLEPNGHSSSVKYRMQRGSNLDFYFGIANYRPMFQLIPVERKVEISAQNAVTWEQIEDYHEHRQIAVQDVQSHYTSELICQTIKEHFGSPTRILELGCGSGRNLAYLANYFPEAEIIGLDINPAALKNEKLPDNVRLIQADVLTYDLSEFKTVDVVLTSGLLMHLNHRDFPSLLENIVTNFRNLIFWELHGESHSWDYHRYPRDYQAVLLNSEIGISEYRIFYKHPITSLGLTDSFAHSLLVSKSK